MDFSKGACHDRQKGVDFGNSGRAIGDGLKFGQIRPLPDVAPGDTLAQRRSFRGVALFLSR